MRKTKVNIQNFVSIEEVSLEFDKTIYIINGENRVSLGTDSNGAGKSLLLESIYFCMFGQTLRNFSMNDLIGPFKDHCRVSMEFENNGNRYVIERKRYSSKSSLNVFVNGVDATLQKIEQTQQYIYDHVIGLSKSQCEISMYSGEYRQHILDLTPTERAKILLSLIDFDQKTYDTINVVLNSAIRSRELTLAKFDQQLESIAQTFEGKKADARKQVETALSNLNGAKESFESVSEIIEKEIVTIDDTISELEALRKQSEEQEKIFAQKIKYTDVEIHQIKNMIDDCDEGIKRAETYGSVIWDGFIGQNDEDEFFADIRNRYFKTSEDEELVDKYNSFLKELDVVLIRLKSYYGIYSGEAEKYEVPIYNKKKEIKELQKQVESGADYVCKSCGTLIKGTDTKHLIYEIAKLNEEITELQKKDEELKNEIKEFENQRKELIEKVRTAYEALTKCVIDFGQSTKFLKSLDSNLAEFFKGLKIPFVTAPHDSTDPKIYEMNYRLNFNYGKVIRTQFIQYFKSTMLPKMIEEYTNKIASCNSKIAELTQQRKELSRLIEKELTIISDSSETIIRQSNAKTKLLERLANARGRFETHQKLYDDMVNELPDKLAALDNEYNMQLEEVNGKTIATKKAISTFQFVKKTLAAFRTNIISQFLSSLMNNINAYLYEINSDLTCNISLEENDVISIDFSDSSKGVFYPYGFFSRGERTRIKKIFNQVLVEIFNPFIVLSDESLDGLDSSGIKEIYSFTVEQNRNRLVLEASPAKLGELLEEAPLTVLVVKDRIDGVAVISAEVR